LLAEEVLNLTPNPVPKDPHPEIEKLANKDRNNHIFLSLYIIVI
jgi:hypothetical protein